MMKLIELYMNRIKRFIDKHSKASTDSFSISDQIDFAQRLSILLGSGISIVEALSMMRNIESRTKIKLVYADFISNIEHGVSLSKTITSSGLKFNNLLMVMIKNGEGSGNLSEALLQAHTYLLKKSELKKKIISALVYPGFIVVATVLMALFLILYIFPKIIPLLTSLDIKLPLMTRMVQMIYYFMISYGLYSFIGFVILCLLFRYAIRRSVFVKYNVHLATISLPILHKYIKINLMIVLSSVGEMLLGSGRGLQELLIFAKEYNTNVVYKEVFDHMYVESTNGVALSVSMNKCKKLFPPLLIDMVSIGERTGNLAEMFGHTSRIFEQDIENLLKRFTSLIEPTLMIFMGLIVGSIALSIILPVYEITNHLSK